MWRSLDSWDKKTKGWYLTNFSEIDEPSIALEAEKYFKIAMRIEKNLDPNPI